MAVKKWNPFIFLEKLNDLTQLVQTQQSIYCKAIEAKVKRGNKITDALVKNGIRFPSSIFVFPQISCFLRQE